MKENRTSLIIKEYYNIISPLLVLSPNDRITEIERQILCLLCESKQCNEKFEECWAAIENAKCLQVYTDGALLRATDFVERSIAYDVKMDVLTNNRISKLRKFDEDIFIEELKNTATIGEKNACKLLAFLNWLGLIVDENKNAAQNIWSFLAMSGDWWAIEMLIYSYSSLKNEESYKRWMNIRNILTNEFKTFSAIALYSNYLEYSENEVQTANIIMFISQKCLSKENVNRPMLYYALYSNDDYNTKMNRLSSETNYYLVLQNEDEFSNKRYGF